MVYCSSDYNIVKGLIGGNIVDKFNVFISVEGKGQVVGMFKVLFVVSIMYFKIYIVCIVVGNSDEWFIKMINIYCGFSVICFFYQQGKVVDVEYFMVYDVLY